MGSLLGQTHEGRVIKLEEGEALVDAGKEVEAESVTLREGFSVVTVDYEWLSASASFLWIDPKLISV